MILGICSIKTGQDSMQAPQVVQAQIDSSDTLPSPPSPISGVIGDSPFFSAAPFSSRLTLISRITARGLSGLPVMPAGQAIWQRPHSVQEKESSRSFQL